MKSAVIALATVIAFFVIRPAAYAQSDSGLITGFYSFQTEGNAQLADPQGSCLATGMVAAALTSGFIHFDGRGHITQGNVGISIGATTCTFPNYSVSGIYNVRSSDANSFTATGTLNWVFQGRPASCGGTLLKDQPFSIIGNRLDKSFTIETSGAGDGSSYAEGPNAGPLSCTATIVNFITRGSGTKNPAPNL